MLWGKKHVIVAASSVAVVLIVGVSVVGFRAYSADQKKVAACAEVQRTEVVAAEGRAAALEGTGKMVAFIGDSYTQGMYLDDPLDAFPYEVARAMGARPFVDAAGGTGYVNKGPCDDGPFTARIEGVVGQTPDVLIIQAGINDRGNDGAASAIEKVMTAAENVPTVYVIGPFETPASSGAPLDAISEAIESAAERHGFTYIDVSGWVFPLLSDQMHPTVEGHHEIAAKLTERLAATLP